jgi:peroxiredoxin
VRAGRSFHGEEAVRTARLVQALLVALAIAASLAACGGGGGGGVDKGGFTQKQRDAAQAGLDALQHMSVSAIVVQTTTTEGLPVCRIHLVRKSPALFELLIVWIPKGQFASSVTSDRYAWLRTTLNEQGPDIRTWTFGNSADFAAVKKSYGDVLSQPVEPCVILNNGRIKETKVSPHTAAETATLRGHGPPVSRRRAPLFNLARVDKSGELSLEALRGKTVVVNFWSAACQRCTGLATTLQHSFEQWQSRGVVVVGIDEFDFAPAERSFIRRYGITYPIVHDPSGVGKRYAVTNVPDTFFIDRRGQIVAHLAGPASAAQIDANIRLALR